MAKQLHPQTEFYQSMQLVGTQYPRIFRRIAQGWGTQPLHDYLTFLMLGDTDHREGFPMNVASAIMAISLKHESDHTHIFTKSHDVLTSIFKKQRW